jgi:cbb3-type cytochrome c oxidase subunit II
MIPIFNQDGDTASLESLAADPDGTQFAELVDWDSENFVSYWEQGLTPETYEEILDMGRDIYIAEGCSQCHTQQVRTVGNDVERYGDASTLRGQNNDLNAPQLLGTHRVGPDLANEGGLRSNAWHIAHFWNPRDVIPNSIMPSYQWFFEDKGVLNEKGYAIIAYMQWLGSYNPVAPADEE